MEPFGNRETIGMRDGTVFGDDADILCIVTLWGIGLACQIHYHQGTCSQLQKENCQDQRDVCLICLIAQKLLPAHYALPGPL